MYVSVYVSVCIYVHVFVRLCGCSLVSRAPETSHNRYKITQMLSAIYKQAKHFPTNSKALLHALSQASLFINSLLQCTVQGTQTRQKVYIVKYISPLHRLNLQRGLITYHFFKIGMIINTFIYLNALKVGGMVQEVCVQKQESTLNSYRRAYEYILTEQQACNQQIIHILTDIQWGDNYFNVNFYTII